ncbi:unnamed protein product [Paramecium octaurelia]|uniref:Uncharacterized protein n=1 Tax=Paramecium octaurelia TaxID=43137 RepID=A0A8S1WBP8_PAROT|nr:unnamed protein product [Paramecium octaurelia]
MLSQLYLLFILNYYAIYINQQVINNYYNKNYLRITQEFLIEYIFSAMQSVSGGALVIWMKRLRNSIPPLETPANEDAN